MTAATMTQPGWWVQTRDDSGTLETFGPWPLDEEWRADAFAWVRRQRDGLRTRLVRVDGDA